MMVRGRPLMRSKPQDFNLTIEKICDQVDHICQIGGNAAHVGIGSDLDGGFGTEQTPLDLDCIADLGRLGGLRAARGFSAADIEGLDSRKFVVFLRRTLPCVEARGKRPLISMRQRAGEAHGA